MHVLETCFTLTIAIISAQFDSQNNVFITLCFADYSEFRRIKLTLFAFFNINTIKNTKHAQFQELLLKMWALTEGSLTLTELNCSCRAYISWRKPITVDSVRLCAQYIHNMHFLIKRLKQNIKYFLQNYLRLQIVHMLSKIQSNSFM